MDYSGPILPEGDALSREAAVRVLAEAGFAGGGGLVLMAPIGQAHPDRTRLFPEHFLIGGLMLASFVGGAMALLH